MLLMFTARAFEVANEFKRDYNIRKQLKNIENKSKHLLLVLGRYLFETEHVKQHVRCFAKDDWKPTDAHRDTTRVQSSGLLQTQLIEDLIGNQKNDTQTQACNTYKRHMTAMASAIQADVIENRHNFTTVQADMPLANKRRLGDDDFKPDANLESLKFEEIANFEQKASFFPPATRPKTTTYREIVLRANTHELRAKTIVLRTKNRIIVRKRQYLASPNRLS